MLCSQCQFELPENAKFCTNCGLSQENAINMAVSQPQKDQLISKLDTEQTQPLLPIGQLDTEQTQPVPHIAGYRGALPTTKIAMVRLPGNKTTVPYTPVPPLLKARFIQNTGPLYIGRVVSITRKPLRRNLLRTRTGLSLLLIILTALFIRVGFAIVYAVFHH